MKKILQIILAMMFLASPVLAQTKGKTTGLPLPRFATMKSKNVNMRVGPGKEYKVQWLYVRSGLPVEIIQEFDRWLQIRDSKGTEGWVFHALLSGKRTAIILAIDPDADPDDQEKFTPAYKSATKNASIIARLQPGAIVTIDRCDGKWCSIKLEGTTGFVEQPVLWGAYPDEKFKG